MHKLLHRDVVAGLVVALLGAGILIAGSGLRLGTAAQMGPGYVPMGIGALLLLGGTGLGLQALLAGGRLPLAPWVWKPMLIILASVLAFALLLRTAGFLPAVFAAAMIASFAEATQTWRSAALVSLGITLASVILFIWLLGLPIPLLAAE